ncbi:MAG: KamA family radical SAM protein [Verrucomicrobiota bacterium]
MTSDPIYQREIEFRPSAPGRFPQVDPADWNNPAWQLRKSLKTLPQLEENLTLAEEERAGLLLTGTKLATSVTPHFFNLVGEDPEDPIRRQVIPRIEESLTDPAEMSDPCGEDSHMPVPGLVHRYPDRVLFLVTDRCASYCRYCTRSRVVSGVSDQKLETQWEAAFEYLEQTPSVRDVLLSGGDPLLLSDNRLNKILTRLRQIPHIQFVRIGSRIPLFLPQRITPELCQMLARHHPLFISIHTNHPRELTSEVRESLSRLSRAGIQLGNQSVLLRGVNDTLPVQTALVHKLLMCRVKPYYLYQCDLIKGSAHLRTSIHTGLKLIAQLRGHTSGYAIPQYVLDAPGGGGKVPLNPQTIISHDDQQIIVQNYEGKKFAYPEVGANFART